MSMFVKTFQVTSIERLLSDGCLGLFVWRVERPCSIDDHLPPFCAEVKNVVAMHVFMASCLIN
jgi:hypothetical protein